MTYSRPGIRQVNVGAGSPRTNTPQVRLPGGSSVSANAPFRDNRSADQVYKNEMQKTQMTRDFLSFFTNTVQPQMAAAIDRNAQKEAQKVIDAFPSDTITSTGTPEQQDAYNSLSPRAKDYVIQSRASTAVAEYPKALEAEYTARPILSAPGNTPEQNEQRAVAQAEAKAAARARVGLDKLPAYTVAQSSEALARADGVVSGQAYKSRMDAQSQLSQVSLIQAGGTAIANGFRDLRVASASDVVGDQPQTVGMRTLLETVAKTQGLNYGGQAQAQMFAGNLQQAIEKTTDVQERVELVRQLKLASATPLNDASGTIDLFSFPLNNSGTSIKTILDEWEGNTEVAADKETLGNVALELFKAQQEGRQGDAMAIFSSAADLINDPSNFPELIRLFKGSQGVIETQEMRAAGFAMEERYMDEGGTQAVATKLFKEMITAPPGKYRAQDIEEMGRRAMSGQAMSSPLEPAREEFNQVQGTQDGAGKVAFAEFYNWAVPLNPKTKQRPPASDEKGRYTPSGLEQRAIFDRLVRDRYYEKWTNRVLEKWDPDQAYIDSTKEVVGEQKQGAGSAQAVTPKSQYLQYAGNAFSQLAQSAASNGGRVTGETIPKEAINPGVYGAWAEQNPGKSFDSLSGLQKEKLLVRSIQTFKRYDPATGQYVAYTEKEATAAARNMMKEAEKKAARSGGSQSVVPETVPETEAELQEFRRNGGSRARATGGGRGTNQVLELLERATDWATTPQEDPFNFNKVFNNGGLGPQAMSYVNGFLNMVTGAAPATAQELAHGTPEALGALRRSWESGQQGLSTPPLPQVSFSTPVRPVPTAISSDEHELFVMVGVAEGTRTASGGYTKAYYGHTDPGDGNYNRGTVSGGRGSSMSPAMVDRRWMGILTGVQQRMRPYLIVYGLQPGTQGYNRVMFNLIDLEVQSPQAARDFAGKLPQMKAGNWTVEAIAKARADSFINPQTGRLEASGFGNSYQRLMKDQRSRAGVYDYRRRM